MKKRGLSAEEKRVKMKELFVETKDVFTLKELEKVCPKQKGIVSQTVKDVLQSLVDDSLVKQDKIGTGNYFWCFPSDELNMRQVRMKHLTKEVENAKRKAESLTEELAQAKKARPESDERKAKLKRLKELQKVNTEMKEELRAHADNNPEIVEAMKTDAVIARDAANRWTDSLFTLKSYFSSNFNVSESDFHAQFEVPEELDYLS